jgi:hypothetical protein
MLMGWTVLAGASSPISPSTSDGAAVLSLSNEHLGMTAAEVEAAQGGSAIESAPSEAEAPLDLQAQVTALEALAEQATQRAHDAAEYAEAARVAVVTAERAEAARLASEAATAALVSIAATGQPVGTSYESCFEASVRRGVAFAESDRTCRASSAGAE